MTINVCVCWGGGLGGDIRIGKAKQVGHHGERQGKGGKLGKEENELLTNYSTTV